MLQDAIIQLLHKISTSPNVVICIETREVLSNPVTIMSFYHICARIIMYVVIHACMFVLNVCVHVLHVFMYINYHSMIYTVHC